MKIGPREHGAHGKYFIFFINWDIFDTFKHLRANGTYLGIGIKTLYTFQNFIIDYPRFSLF